jgi:multiple sugar transport system substrate-binding protein
MSALSRRHFRALSSAAASGIEGIVAARRAPAHAQGTRLHLLQWSHFIPAADTLFEAQAREFGKQAGAEIQIERINQNDIQTRVTAAVQSGAGADIIILANNHAHVYESSLVDVSDVAEEIGRTQGGWYDYAKVNWVAGGRWIGVPQFIISWAITYREDWLKEAGFAYPKTWDDFRRAGRALKAKGGRPGLGRQQQQPRVPLQRDLAHRRARWGTPDRPDARPPRCCPSTSSSTCSPNRSRA